MSGAIKDYLSLFFSLLIILIIETSVLMLSWNYVLYDIFNANRITITQSLVFLMVYRFILNRDKTENKIQ
tara:strand:- start:1284 stop:1493 length:210 start_codon:yes stop_codon:yes gene_type:complete